MITTQSSESPCWTKAAGPRRNSPLPNETTRAMMPGPTVRSHWRPFGRGGSGNSARRQGSRPDRDSRVVMEFNNGAIIRHAGPARQARVSLEALPEPFLQFVPVPTTQRKPRSIAQDDDILAVEPGLQFLDPLGVDDARAVDADEAARVEARLHVGHRLAEEMRLFTEMQAHVVARGLDPIEIFGAQEEHAATRLHDQAIELRRLGLDVVD